MVNGVSREVTRPKPKGMQAQGFWPQNFPGNSISPRIFIFLASRARIRDLIQPMDSLGSPLNRIPNLDSKYW